MITNTRLTTIANTTVFTATQDGISAPNASTNPGQTRAVTTMILCNTGTPILTDESADTAAVTIYMKDEGVAASASNMIVSSLTIPAGETVFFSDEKLILEGSGNTCDEITVQSDAANLITVTVSSLPV